MNKRSAGNQDAGSGYRDRFARQSRMGGLQTGRTAAMNRIAYWRSVLVTLAAVAVAVYYGYWGLNGLRLWA